MLTALVLCCGGLSLAAPSDDPELRGRVARLIAVLEHPEASSKNLEQTRQAIDELSRIGPPAVPQLVESILGGHRSGAPYSANALDRMESRAVEAVRREFEALDEVGRWKLMRFRGKFDYDASLDFALASLDSKQEEVRLHAIRHLGQYKEAKARDKLLVMLNSDVPRLRWEVIEALSAIGGDDVIDAFIELLSPTSWVAKGEGLTHPAGRPPRWWPDGRPQLIQALHRLNARRAGSSLIEVLAENGPGTGYLGPIIIPVLRDLEYVEAVPELRRILATDADALAQSHPPGEIHASAAATLWHFGDRLGRVALIQVMLKRDRDSGAILSDAFSRLTDKSDLWLLERWLPGRSTCETLEAITGIRNRAPGWAVPTERDGPLWIEWFKQHRSDLPTMAFDSPRALRRERVGYPFESDDKLKPLGQEEFNLLWAILAGDSQPATFRAMLRLASTPRATVRFLAPLVEPPAVVDPVRIRRLISQLDADDFVVREAAEAELDRMQDRATAELRIALSGKLSTEAALRIRRVLARHDDSVKIRQLRAIAVLETIGTEEALALLVALTRGDPASHVTLEAAAAVERLKVGARQR